MMKLLKTIIAAVTLIAGIGCAQATAQDKITIDVQYPLGFIFDKVFAQLKTQFEKANPDITVHYLPAYKEYEDAAQTALREAITRQLPDVSVQAINLQRLFVDRHIAVDLSPFIANEHDWKGQGFSESMMALSTFGGKPYGLAFAASTPIIYFNEDLVKKAGGDPDHFPSTWDGIFALSNKIAKLGDGDIGLFHSWQITGNWMWQALVFSYGGRMTSPDEKKVAFDQEPGKNAIELLGRMVREGGMPDMTQEESRAAFFAGKLGILTESTSLLRVIDNGVAGKFKWRTARFPVPGPDARLPTGGCAAMMFATRPAREAAAWKYMKFITGPLGATIMVKGTGYMPPNALPANDPALLKSFYATRPNYLTSISQQPLMTAWYAFPGKNSLKIIQVIKDHLQSVVNKSVEPDTALRQMASEVQNLLPN